MTKWPNMIALAVSPLATSVTVHSMSVDGCVKEAQVSLARARAVVLNAQPGKITAEKLEKEPGGSGLRYSFDISTQKGTQEVGVDACTCAVLEHKVERTFEDWEKI
ncbi:PepSY domain-containing protein [Paraburkholderia sp. A3BS-1L]|uniref:PepSY domain-containing protein n=1 Tax=Paraburkholderia sp. A3BS-1L TaxID=3028375 RepID=UPI003DA8CC80